MFKIGYKITISKIFRALYVYVYKTNLGITNNRN